MKLIVWGAGRLYQKYRGFLSQFHIVKLCDSNTDKQGSYIGGIEVIGPAQLMKYDFDYVVVVAYRPESICDALKDLKVPQEKILLHSQMYLLKHPQICVNHLGREIPFCDWISGKEKHILLISHVYSYTGVPVALKNMANVLKKMGYSVLMASMEDGPFTAELELQKIDYVTDLEIAYETQDFIDMLKQFDAIVMGTFCLYSLVEMLEDTLEGTLPPTFWWIHESAESCYIRGEALVHNENITFLAGGNRVKRVFLEHYPDVGIKKLQYCLPDSHKQMSSHLECQKKDSALTVAVIGTIDSRKAQDTFLESIITMPLSYQSQLKVIMVGRLTEVDISFAEKIREQQKQIQNLDWIQEMSQEQLDEFYEDIDVLVCPSRDDPMPIVVTQAVMHGKICVVSDEVGQAEFIRPQENGFVFPCDDVNALQRILIWLIDNRESISEIGAESRKIFDREFSEAVMEQQLRIILDSKNDVKDI